MPNDVTPPSCGTCLTLGALLTQWRDKKPFVTEVSLSALGIRGDVGFQCELGFGDASTKSFQDTSMDGAINQAMAWVRANA